MHAAELTLLPDSIITCIFSKQLPPCLRCGSYGWKIFRHCVTQLSDVFGGGRDVSSRSTDSLPQHVALSLANTLHYLLEEDVEMLARFLPDLRNLH